MREWRNDSREYSPKRKEGRVESSGGDGRSVERTEGLVAVRVILILQQQPVALFHMQHKYIYFDI